MRIDEISACRICGGSLATVMDLGMHALSGRFPKIEEPDPPSSPLVLVKCEGDCGLLQLKHEVSAQEMFGHLYGYRSGINRTMTNHLKSITKEIEDRLDLKEGEVVLDIGSNDATLLKSYDTPGLAKIGIDPTGRQFAEYYPEDSKLVPDFFTLENFKKASEKKAKSITSIAMFYDLPDPLQFVKDVKAALDEEGIWTFEQSYMPRMLEQNAFDTVCHEHLEYYGLRQIKYLLDETDMKIVDVQFNDINGGSFRITAAHEDSGHEEATELIKKILKKEKSLDSMGPYIAFVKRVGDIRKKLVDFIREEKANGKVFYLYGASTKGNTLLQYFNIDDNMIMGAAEKNPKKFGHKTPGTHIPIVSEAVARKEADYFLVLPWHFREEFVEREKAFMENGGILVFPLPEFEVVAHGMV